jgi:AcrR family transcriptional regulator
MRKKPVQTRSREMVDALVQATAHTIAERGLAEATTNQIAARAGVSVGSLYQYFEGKDALVRALTERLTSELAALVDERLGALMHSDVRTAVRGLLGAVFDRLEGNAAYVELARHWPELRGQRTIPDLEKHMLEACRQYFLRHHDVVRVRNLPAAMFVVVSSTLYTVVHYLSEPRPFLRRQEVVDNLTEMIASFLESDGDGIRATPSRRPRAPSRRGAARNRR